MLEFNEVPFNRALKFELRRRDESGAEIALPIAEWFSQENGVVHGGIISALADTAGVYAVRGDRAMTGIELKINFLRPAAMTGGALIAIASIVRRGGTIAVAEVDVQQDGQSVAHGLFTYLFVK
ncbi:MAG TPA: PaaI family thioesterase [Thermoanaerobaculia bacterium]|nr:PaaI family thioesterase [Thermoanaerobaculia bacterium]